MIGQKAVPAGGNEITAARQLLELLALKGALVTADAIHCQGDTAALVLARGFQYQEPGGVTFFVGDMAPNHEGWATAFSHLR